MPKALLLVLLCLGGTGCIHHNTPAKRAASFSPYLESKAGTNDLWEYLTARSGMLLGGERLKRISSGTNSLSFTNAVSYGTAAAIDQRGYFLTAAHCVEKGQRWLVFLRDGQAHAERARVVWRGNEKKGDPDLAILCVAQPIGLIFQWATEWTNGSPVVGVGLNITGPPRNLHAEPLCLAGKILKAEDAVSKTSLDYTVVFHSSPLRPGDSGGPLLLPDGRLLGINVSAKADFKWSQLAYEFEHSHAHRPDLGWLRKVIDADAASHSIPDSHAAP